MDSHAGQTPNPEPRIGVPILTTMNSKSHRLQVPELEEQAALALGFPCLVNVIVVILVCVTIVVFMVIVVVVVVIRNRSRRRRHSSSSRRRSSSSSHSIVLFLFLGKP